ncbi:MAG: MptD family putative ECF transporter S component [Coriobacteriaceae bacterium]|nr:MptD family putative ECF transporter S component [Coriobacteriaceae bacterium]
MSGNPSSSRVLKGRDLITIGIFTALYAVVNFLFMLIAGLHPYLWVFMPALDALFAGIPFMLACAKVPKFGTVLIIGMVPSILYFSTGMFTPLILGLMLASCLVAEIIRAATRYKSFAGNAVAYAVFGFGMCGSPLPFWLFHDSFVSQIAESGMGADYLATLETAASPAMLVAMLVSTFVAGLVGAWIARGMFKKHFEKAGLA